MSDVTDRAPGRTLRAVGGGLVIAALGVGLLAGCQDDGGSAGARKSPPTPATSARPTPSSAPTSQGATTAPPTFGHGSATPPRRSTPAGTKDLLTLHGTMVRGVEPGCKILKTSKGQYELVGVDKKTAKVLTTGNKVTVRGYREHGMMSHCMQGPIIRIVSARPAH